MVWQFFEKLKTYHMTQPFHSQILPKIMKINSNKDLYVNVYSNCIHHNPQKETAKMSINR